MVSRIIDANNCDIAHARRRESHGILIRNLVIDHREDLISSNGNWSLTSVTEARAVLLTTAKEVELVVIIRGRSILLARLIVAKMTIVIVPCRTKSGA